MFSNRDKRYIEQIEQYIKDEIDKRAETAEIDDQYVIVVTDGNSHTLFDCWFDKGEQHLRFCIPNGKATLKYRANDSNVSSIKRNLKRIKERELAKIEDAIGQEIDPIIDAAASDDSKADDSMETISFDNDDDWENFNDIKCRNVFVFKEFRDSLQKISQNRKVSGDFSYKLIRKMISIEDDILERWLNRKHCFPVPCTNGLLLYRMRPPRPEGIDDLTRVFICKGDQINRAGIKDNDLVLVYCLDKNEHEAEDYKLLADAVSEELLAASESSFERVQQVKKTDKYGLLYKASIKNDKKEVVYVPVLDEYQANILNGTLKISPPRVIYGAAGTGKTLLSEELYEDLLTSHSDYQILYVTYMPRLRNQVKKDFSDRGVENVNAFTFDDLVLEYVSNVKDNPSVYKRETDFKHWLEQNATVKKYKLGSISDDRDIAVSTAYIFFRSVSISGDYNSFSDRDKFIQQTKNEEGISDEAKNVIFSVCKDYERYLKDKKYITDNIAAKIISETVTGKYDAIIVDEIQDLTEIQIESLLKLLKKNSLNFYAFGDDNQTINPTLMRLSRADEIICSHLTPGKNRPEEIVLNNSYRSSSYLISYINYINKIRSKTIGRDKEFNEVEQTTALPLREDNATDKPACVFNKAIIENGLNDENIFATNDIMVIVPNQELYENLKTKFPKLFINDASKNLMTIEETKGGEWDTVILYNFFSSAVKVWGNFVDISQNNQLRKLHSTISRMYFNRYYVGLTRAANKVIIAETGTVDDKIKSCFLPEQNHSVIENSPILSLINNRDDFGLYFENDYTYDIWTEKAKESFDLGEYDIAYDRICKAIRALSLGNENDKQQHLDELSLLQEQYSLYREFSSRDTISDLGEIELYLDEFIKYRDETMILNVYQKSNQESKQALVKTDITRNPKEFISKLKQVKSRTKLFDSEDEYYTLKYVKAYRQLISDEMKGI